MNMQNLKLKKILNIYSMIIEKISNKLILVDYIKTKIRI